MGGVCDHINHFGSHIKEIGLWKTWGGGHYAERAWGEHCIEMIGEPGVHEATNQTLSFGDEIFEGTVRLVLAITYSYM